MNERMDSISLAFQGEQDSDGVMGVHIPDGKSFELFGVSHFITFTGTPTVATIDIQDDGTDIAAAIDVLTANDYTALAAPVVIAGGSAVEIDLNTAGGTTPAATGEVVLFGFWGE